MDGCRHFNNRSKTSTLVTVDLSNVLTGSGMSMICDLLPGLSSLSQPILKYGSCRDYITVISSYTENGI